MTTEIKDILEHTYYGNWEDAIQEYKKLGISPAKMSELLNKMDVDELKRIALVGYYAIGEMK